MYLNRKTDEKNLFAGSVPQQKNMKKSFCRKCTSENMKKFLQEVYLGKQIKKEIFLQEVYLNRKTDEKKEFFLQKVYLGKQIKKKEIFLREVYLNRKTDEKKEFFLQEVYLNRKTDNQALKDRLLHLSEKSQKSLHTVQRSAGDEPCFVIEHYAGEVHYSVCDLVVKNKVCWSKCVLCVCSE